MILTREQIERAVKLDYVNIEEIKNRDLIRDPISGIRVAVSGDDLILQDLRTRVGDPHAIAVIVSVSDGEVGAAATGEEVQKCAMAVQMVADEGGDARVDLSAGGCLGVRLVGLPRLGLVELVMVGPDGCEASLALDQLCARKVAGALLTLIEFFKAQEEVKRRGRNR